MHPTLLLAFLVLGGGAASQQAAAQPAQPQAQSARPNPCDAPEFRHFDFWIGKWEVKGPGGQLLGHNVIEPIAGKCGVHENWAGRGGASGYSVNTYHTDGKWHQAWVGNGGGLLHLMGNLQEGKMVLEGTTVGPNQQKTLHRVTWTPLEDGRVRQYWESSTDEGKTWGAAFDGFYSKKTG